MSHFYSQNGEDLVLEQLFAGKGDGFFVEVGCIDGRRFSNTLRFEERGWKGICVEAHADYVDLLRKNRPHSIIAHCAASDRDADEAVFYANSRGSLSTLDPSKESHFRDRFGAYFTGFEEQRVPRRRLDSLFREHCVREIDILSLDIEGSEVDALRGLDLGAYAPKVIVVESDDETDTLAIDRMLATGYTRIYRLSGNLFYLSDRYSPRSTAAPDARIRGAVVHTQHPLDSGGDRCIEVDLAPLPQRAFAGRLRFYSSGFHGDRYLLSVIEPLLRNAEYFIETGANVGSTLAFVARNFPHLKCLSCEPDPVAYAEAAANAGSPNVVVYNEPAQRFLRRLREEHAGVLGARTVLWLDAHGHGFEWPLLQEVAFVTSHFSSAMMFIDDFRVPGLDQFGFDSYAGQECSFAYIEPVLNHSRRYALTYPAYTEPTSSFHPLRGWVLISDADAPAWAEPAPPRLTSRAVHDPAASDSPGR